MEVEFEDYVSVRSPSRRLSLWVTCRREAPDGG